MICLVFVAALLLGCHNIAEPYNNEVKPPRGSALAADITVALWSDVASESISPRNRPNVRWFDGDCLAYPLDEDPFPQIDNSWCIVGAHYKESFPRYHEIHLIYRDQPSSSALTHELLHWSLWQLEQDGDADHSHPWWDKVPEVNRKLRQVGF